MICLNFPAPAKIHLIWIKTIEYFSTWVCLFFQHLLFNRGQIVHLLLNSFIVLNFQLGIVSCFWMNCFTKTGKCSGYHQTWSGYHAIRCGGKKTLWQGCMEFSALWSALFTYLVQNGKKTQIYKVFDIHGIKKYCLLLPDKIKGWGNFNDITSLTMTYRLLLHDDL